MKNYEENQLIKFDTVKIRTRLDYFKQCKVPFNQNYNHKTGKINGLYYNSKNDSSIPYNLFIGVSNYNSSLTIEFSSKVLLDDYPKLITKDTFHQCISNINNLGICELNADAISNDCYFSKAHITKDIQYTLTDNALNSLNQRVNDYRRYKWTHYDKSGITFTKDVKSKDCKESITIYNKHKEICSSKNDKFLSYTRNPEQIKNSFQGITRFEVKYDTMEKIKTELNITDAHINQVFNSTANPILAQFDKVFGDIEIQSPKFKISNFDEFAMKIIIENYNYDLKLIEQDLRSAYSSRSGLTNKMKQIQKFYNCIIEKSGNHSDELLNIRKILAMN